MICKRLTLGMCLFLAAAIFCCAPDRGREVLRLQRDNFLQLKKDPHLEITNRFHHSTRILVQSDYPSLLKQEYSGNNGRSGSGIDLSKFGNRIVRILFSEEPPKDAAFIKQYKSSQQPPDLESFRKRHQRDNVLVIVFDALNPSHLGCYGYSRNTSPVIDRVASESLIWDRAFALAPYTLASTGALLTGLHPIVHGVLGEGNKLPQNFKTMAEFFHDAGYDTGMFLATPNATEVFGYTQGFQNVWQPARVINADEITSQVNRWLEKPRRHPFFAYIHFREPHLPYNPPEKYLRLFRDETNFRLPKFDFGVVPPMEDQSKIRDAYDGNIAFADSELQKILTTLQEKGLREKTIVVLLSDHGEAFWEHGVQGHNRNLYDEMLRTPLVLHIPREPALKNIRKKQLVSNFDLFATFIDLFPFSKKGILLNGESLLPYLFSDHETGRWLSLQIYAHPDYAIRSSQMKYILDEDRKREELYLLSKDPLEKNNVALRFPIVAAYCRAELKKLRSRFHDQREALQIEQPKSVISPETREHLKALGYVQ